jgi:lysophospholipase L1-like esterase
MDYRNQALHSLGSDKEGFEIIMLGDSITAGGNWEQLLDVDVANYGIGGDTPLGLLYRLSDVYMAHPKRVFLMIGINDILSSNNFENYKKVIENLMENGIEVIIQSTLYVSKEYPNWEKVNGAVDELNSGLKSVCMEKGLTFIDVNKILSLDGALKKEYTNDGVHLLSIGYKKWRELIIPIITNN